MSHVRYIDRTRAYYESQGYDKPYEWAHFEDVPFSTLKKPLSECRVELASTSDIAIKPEKGVTTTRSDGDFVGTVKQR